jgi:UDP-N-acetylmuramoyl-tripeptide--D-alanyl-D-alanine ligase
MRILEGINNTTVIDDSYNASPIAVQEALKSLSKIENKGVKIAVLGDMSEIGRYTANEHKIIGSMVADLEIDYLLTFGKRAEFIYEEALISGMSEEKVFKFSEFGELSKKLKELTKEGSVVLIKGSQVMRTEKIVKQVMKEPEKARELLVRQDDFWLG